MLKIIESVATIPAQDIKRARQFYEQKLGLTATEEQQDGSVMYRTGDTSFLVFPSMGKASGDHTQLGLDVDDIMSAANELKGKGVKLEDYDYPDFKTKDGIAELADGSKGAWFKDTEGNLIALAQRVPATTRAR
ncbi:MAG TPA: VOC family protein [Candidatus Dormibacteraeota bacterium]|jgi:predicted enzyme related to lactoylglutathione lyase